MDKISSQIVGLKNTTTHGSDQMKADKVSFDQNVAEQRRKIGTPIIKTSTESPVSTIQLGKVMTAAARDTGEKAAVYETTRTVGLGDLVGNLTNSNQFGAESNVKSILNQIPDEDMPEVAIVSADTLGESDVTFKSALIGDTMFLSDKVYDNWCCGKDEGQLETALEDLTTNWLSTKS